MIEALRGFGYTIQTAIADLLDNSITAQARNVWLTFRWAGKDSYVAILDDGIGMTEQALSAAMRPGSRNPLETRDPNDLGRFGLGLKTASFSQCRRITVASRVGGHTAIRRWDLDHVAAVNDWQLLYGPAPGLKKHLERIEQLEHGTLVLWENMDRVVGDLTISHEHAFNRFLELIERVATHLAMIFHRFLEGARPIIRLHINEKAVAPWDPFMITHPATISTPVEKISTSVGQIKFQGFILPHKDRLSLQQFHTGGGPEGWTSQQGFYVYRNRRMLVPGNWLGMGSPRRWTREEPYKLARICLDIPNAADAEWKIDVKKSMAHPPDYLRQRLMELADYVRQQARRVLAHRGAHGRRAPVKEIQRAWIPVEKPDGICYQISRDHPAVVRVLALAGDHMDAVEDMLHLIEETVPVQRIWLDAAERDETHREAFQGAPEADVAKVLRALYQNMVHDLHLAPDEARERLLKTEPFQNSPHLVEAL
jgi:hypothetical protein